MLGGEDDAIPLASKKKVKRRGEQEGRCYKKVDRELIRGLESAAVKGNAIANLQMQSS